MKFVLTMVTAFRYFEKNPETIYQMELNRTAVEVMRHFTKHDLYWGWWWTTGEKECADRLEEG